VAVRPDPAIKPVSRRTGFKADIQAAVSVGQSLDRPLDRQRRIVDIAEKPDLPDSTPSAIATACFSLATSKATKDFAILSHGPPSVPEARLGLPEQPSFPPA
jgi:hypothetical protein